MLYIIPLIFLSFRLFLLFFLVFFFFLLRKLIYKRETVYESKRTKRIYECGYNTINNHKFFYTIQFFLIALSFIFFDLEVVLYLPCVYTFLYSVNITIRSLIFLILLTRRLLIEFIFDIF